MYKKSGLLHDNSFLTGFITAHDTDSAPNMPHEGCVNGKHWIKFVFDRIYSLDAMWVWNYNESAYASRGWKDVTIQFSTVGGANPADWTTLGGLGATHQFAIATGENNDEHGSNEFNMVRISTDSAARRWCLFARRLRGCR